MTVADVHARVEAIKAEADDDERAHGMEDDLHFDVLVAITKGDEDPQGLARAAIVTKEIKFARWCA